MLSKKVLSKILSAGTVRAVLGVLLGATLTSSSWGMLKDEDQDTISCKITLSRIVQLRKFAIEIIEFHNKEKNRIQINVTSSSTSHPVNNFFAIPLGYVAKLKKYTFEFIKHHPDENKIKINVPSSLKSQHLENFLGFESLTTLDSYLSCFFDYSYKYMDGLMTFSFKPTITTDFLFLDTEKYIERKSHDMWSWFPQLWIQTPEEFKLYPNEFAKSNHPYDTNKYFKESCCRSLYSFTHPEVLNRLKKSLLDSDFEFYRLVLSDDKGSFFYSLPNEVKWKIIMINY